MQRFLSISWGIDAFLCNKDANLSFKYAVFRQLTEKSASLIASHIQRLNGLF